MNCIVDTSVWIDHMKSPVLELQKLLSDRQVLVHPVVLGELACGTFRKRHEVLGNLRVLPRAQLASLDEVLELIELKKLYGKGLGFGDVQIIASAFLMGASVLTRDRALKAAIKIL
jgi:predicted nucleic acid-binding protein